MDNAAAVKVFTGRLEKMPEVVRQAGVKTINEAALLTKQAFLAAPGAPRFLRGVGKRGAKVGVRYKLLGGTSNPSAVVRWWGPAHLVNNPTKAHDIKPRGSSGRRRSGAKALLINGDMRASSHRKATTGKHFFEAGREAARIALPRVHQRAVHDGLATIFKG